MVTTAGPGCTNAVTGIATAFRSESPVLHIGGQSALNQWKMGGLQDLPHVDMMKPITKFASTVMSTERIADMISMAARECFAGAYGPSYLEIPRDVLDREIESSKAVLPKPGHYRASTKSLGDPRDIERLADILVNAERPAILLGQQVFAARGHEEAIALLRGLDIPGYFNGAARGLLPPGDPHHFDRTRSLAFGKADVVVIVGTPFDFRMGYGKRIGVPTLVQVDMDYKHRRQEPRRVARHRRRSRRRARRRAPGRFGPLEERQAREAAAMDEGARAGRGGSDAKADGDVHLGPVADPSLPRGL